MKYMILACKGKEGKYPPTKDHVKKILEPWFSKKGWRITGFHFAKEAVLLALTGEMETINIDELITQFDRYIEEEFDIGKDFGNILEIAVKNTPSLHLADIEVVHFSENAGESDHIFNTLVMRLIAAGLTKELKEIDTRIDDLTGKFALLAGS